MKVSASRTIEKKPREFKSYHPTAENIFFIVSRQKSTAILIQIGYPSIDISNLTFQVRAWNNEYCFNGRFVKDSSGTVQIVRKYCVPGVLEPWPG